MHTQTAIRLAGSKAKLSRILNVSRAAVTQYHAILPPKRIARLRTSHPEWFAETPLLQEVPVFEKEELLQEVPVFEKEELLQEVPVFEKEELLQEVPVFEKEELFEPGATTEINLLEAVLTPLENSSLLRHGNL